MSQSRRNLARSYLLIYEVSGAGISATNQAKSTLRQAKKYRQLQMLKCQFLYFAQDIHNFSIFIFRCHQDVFAVSGGAGFL